MYQRPYKNAAMPNLFAVADMQIFIRAASGAASTTLNERSTTADAWLSTIRQSLATADGHLIKLNRCLDTIDESFTAVEGQITAVSRGLTALDERSATSDGLLNTIRKFPH
jgi:ABC-type transporter Mla subunit MlaD